MAGEGKVIYMAKNWLRSTLEMLGLVEKQTRSARPARKAAKKKAVAQKAVKKVAKKSAKRKRR
jgi:hypothetical protein